jgi:hypothetical protein
VAGGDEDVLNRFSHGTFDLPSSGSITGQSPRRQQALWRNSRMRLSYTRISRDGRVRGSFALRTEVYAIYTKILVRYIALT